MFPARKNLWQWNYNLLTYMIQVDPTWFHSFAGVCEKVGCMSLAKLFLYMRLLLACRVCLYWLYILYHFHFAAAFFVFFEMTKRISV